MSEPDQKEKKAPGREGVEKSKGKRKYLVFAIGALAVALIAVYGAFMVLSPATITAGDTVSMYYTMAYENGTVISTNTNSTPLELTVGAADVIPGFSNAIIGMVQNQKKTVLIPYDQAYGPYRSDLIRVVNRTGPIANTTFATGQYYTIHSKTSNATSVIRIINVTPLTVTWDENNPLAGQNLSFTVQVVSVNKGRAGSAGGTTLPRIDSAFDVPVPSTNATKNF